MEVRLLTAFMLLALVLLPGCATRSAVSSSRGDFRLSGNGFSTQELEASVSSTWPTTTDSSPWPRLDAGALEQARRIETERVVESLWAVAGTTNTLEAEWDFRFWSHGGTLTLLSLKRTEQGERLVAPISRGAFLPRLARDLPELLGSRPGEVILTLEREETRWSADLDTASRESPPVFSRTLPSTRSGASTQAYQQALDASRRIERLMTVSQGGSAQLVLQVLMEDERIVSWAPAIMDSHGSGPRLDPSPEAVTMVVRTLLLFTHGLGERTVRITLEGMHRMGEPRPRWDVVEAHTLEPPPPPQEVADFHREYRAMHESIIVEFQEQSRETAVLAASISLEQLAYSIVGGLLLKGIGVIVGKAAPTVVSVLSQGGSAAVRWFRNLLVRAPRKDRELLIQLSLKVETQGFQALTEVEKQELRAIMGRLEKVLVTPLDKDAKGRLWEWSRSEYFTVYNPQLASALGQEGMTFYQVHHRCPMQYAHMFPTMDITGKANVVGIHRDVHFKISKVWGSLGESSARMNPEYVSQVMTTIDRHFGRWFHKVYDPEDAAALVHAEQAALREVAALKASLLR
ncbi:MAG TPA: hypothetical protein VF815_20590 [Myxococcaceae bacterium]|jgi:hypothetical protein